MSSAKPSKPLFETILCGPYRQFFSPFTRPHLEYSIQSHSILRRRYIEKGAKSRCDGCERPTVCPVWSSSPTDPWGFNIHFQGHPGSFGIPYGSPTQLGPRGHTNRDVVLAVANTHSVKRWKLVDYWLCKETLIKLHWAIVRLRFQHAMNANFLNAMV